MERKERRFQGNQKRREQGEVHPQYEIGVMPNDTTRGSNKRVHPTHEIIVTSDTERRYKEKGIRAPEEQRKPQEKSNG